LRTGWLSASLKTRSIFTGTVAIFVVVVIVWCMMRSSRQELEVTRNSKVDSEVVGHRTKVVSRQTPRRMEMYVTTMRHVIIFDSLN